MKIGDLVRYINEFRIKDDNDFLIIIDDDYKLFNAISGVRYSKSFGKRKVFLLFSHGKIITEFADQLEKVR